MKIKIFITLCSFNLFAIGCQRTNSIQSLERKLFADFNVVKNSLSVPQESTIEIELNNLNNINQFLDSILPTDAQNLIEEYLNENDWNCISTISANGNAFEFCDSEIELSNEQLLSPYLDKLVNIAKLSKGDKILCELKNDQYIIKLSYCQKCEIWKKNKDEKCCLVHSFDKPGKVIKLSNDTIIYYNYKIRKKGFFNTTESIDYNFIETWQNIDNKWIRTNCETCSSYHIDNFELRMKDFYNFPLKEQLYFKLHGNPLLKNKTSVNYDYQYTLRKSGKYDNTGKWTPHSYMYNICINFKNGTNKSSIILDKPYDLAQIGSFPEKIDFLELNSSNEFIFYTNTIKANGNEKDHLYIFEEKDGKWINQKIDTYYKKIVEIKELKSGAIVIYLKSRDILNTNELNIIQKINYKWLSVCRVQNIDDLEEIIPLKDGRFATKDTQYIKIYSTSSLELFSNKKFVNIPKNSNCAIS